jgi:hypothetical protein
MQKLVFFIIIATLFWGCQKNSVKDGKSKIIASTAVITGRDLTKCACCWGWIIEINNAVYKFDRIPASSPLNLDALTYPTTVQIQWRNSQGSCSG